MTTKSAPSVTTRDQIVDILLGWMETFYLQMQCFPPNGWQEGELSRLELRTLMFLNRGDGQMGEIGTCLDTSPSTATRTVDSLATRGLVNRQHSSDDRRVVRCSLTSEGSQQVQNFWDMNRRRLQEAIQPLSDEELATITRAMEILMRVFPDASVPLVLEP